MFPWASPFSLWPPTCSQCPSIRFCFPDVPCGHHSLQCSQPYLPLASLPLAPPQSHQLLLIVQTWPCSSQPQALQMHPFAHSGHPASLPTLLLLSGSSLGWLGMPCPLQGLWHDICSFHPPMYLFILILNSQTLLQLTLLLPRLSGPLEVLLRSSPNFPRLSKVLFPLPFSCNTCTSQVLPTTLRSPQPLTQDFKIQRALEKSDVSHNSSGSTVWLYVI